MGFIDWYARHHVKLGVAGLALTAILNLIGAGGHLFMPGWWSMWLPSYAAWTAVVLIGVSPRRGRSK